MPYKSKRERKAIRWARRTARNRKSFSPCRVRVFFGGVEIGCCGDLISRIELKSD